MVDELRWRLKANYKMAHVCKNTCGRTRNDLNSAPNAMPGFLARRTVEFARDKSGNLQIFGVDVEFPGTDDLIEVTVEEIAARPKPSPKPSTTQRNARSPSHFCDAHGRTPSDTQTSISLGKQKLPLIH